MNEQAYLEQFAGDWPVAHAITICGVARVNPMALHLERIASIRFHYLPVDENDTVYERGEPIGKLLHVTFEGLDLHFPAHPWEAIEQHAPKDIPVLDMERFIELPEFRQCIAS